MNKNVAVEPYEAFIDASLACIKLNIKNLSDYKEKRFKDEKLPSNPEEFYSLVWNNEGGYESLFALGRYSFRRLTGSIELPCPRVMEKDLLGIRTTHVSFSLEDSRSKVFDILDGTKQLELKERVSVLECLFYDVVDELSRSQLDCILLSEEKRSRPITLNSQQLPLTPDFT